MDRLKTITYTDGDATEPVGDGPKIIVHCCNSVGAWGSGFVLAVSKKWTEPELEYRKLRSPITLGSIQMVEVDSDLWVCNLVGQDHIRPKGGIPPIRYEAFRKGFKALAIEACSRSATIHMPRMGCALAGGSWKIVELLIDDELVDEGLDVTVYDFDGGVFNP